MESCFEYNFNELSDFNMSFIVDIGRTNWYTKDLKNCEITKDLKNVLPSKKMFNINSMIYDLQQHKKEVLSKYDCYYNKEQNSFSLIMSEKTKYADFTKEILMNLLEFAQTIEVDTIYILIAKSNPDYVRILQALLTVGFENDKAKKNIENNNNVYKVLKMDMQGDPDQIEEVTF